MQVSRVINRELKVLPTPTMLQEMLVVITGAELQAYKDTKTPSCAIIVATWFLGHPEGL